MRDRGSGSSDDSRGGASGRGGAPGKRTLTSGIVQRSARIGGPPPVADEAATPGDGQSSPALIDDGQTPTGDQMTRTAFVEAARTRVEASANEGLAPTGRTTRNCPYISRGLAYYAGRPVGEVEAVARRYANQPHGTISPMALIAAIEQRIRAAVDTWVTTGRITDVPDAIRAMLTPTDLEPTVPPPGAAGAATQPQQKMGAGAPLDSGTASQAGAAYGSDFSGVQVHTGPEAAGVAASHDARAVTVGQDIAFAPGAYAPGTLEGDALLGHELAHVDQQRGAAPEAAPALTDGAAEADADLAATSFMRRVWGGMRAGADRGGAGMRTGMRLARCDKDAAAWRGAFPPNATAEDLRIATARDAFQRRCSLDNNATYRIDAALRAAAGNNPDLLIGYYGAWNGWHLRDLGNDRVGRPFRAKTEGGGNMYVSVDYFNSESLASVGATLLHEYTHRNQPNSSVPTTHAEAYAYGIESFFLSHAVLDPTQAADREANRGGLGNAYGQMVATGFGSANNDDAERLYGMHAAMTMRLLYIVIEGRPRPWLAESNIPNVLRTLTPARARQLANELVASGGNLSGEIEQLFNWVSSWNPSYLIDTSRDPPAAAQPAAPPQPPQPPADAGAPPRAAPHGGRPPRGGRPRPR